MTITELRKSFWDNNPQFKSQYRKTYRQNQYCCDIRCSWVDFLDHMLKSGEITEKQAFKAIL